VLYHKSGYELVQEIKWAFRKECSGEPPLKLGLMVQPLNKEKLQEEFLEKDITSALEVPHTQLRWFFEEVNSSAHRSQHRVSRAVHFVRDPIDLIISALLYHSLDPPDGRESFLVDKAFNPCESRIRDNRY
jgi:hypothetical protein